MSTPTYTLAFTSNSSIVPGKDDIVIQSYHTDGPAIPTNPALNGGQYNSILSSTSLLLYGKGVTNYGQHVQNNILYMLENFAGPIAPVNPTIGQQWFDTSNNSMKVFTTTDIYGIVGGNQSLNQFIVTDIIGGQSTQLSQFVVTGSTGNDKMYHASSVASAGGQLTITLMPGESIPTNTFDGTITRLDWITVTYGFVSKSGDSMTGPLILNADPTLSLGASTKQYTDTKVSKAGDTMTGTLVLSADPINPLDATTKQYADTINATTTGLITTHVGDATVHVTSTQSTLLDGLSPTLTSIELNYVGGVTSSIQTQLDDKLSLTGGTMLGMLTLSANPINPLDAATKQYIDALVVTMGADGVVDSGTLDASTGLLTLHTTVGNLVDISGIAPFVHIHPATDVNYTVSTSDSLLYQWFYVNYPGGPYATYPLVNLQDVIFALGIFKADTESPTFSGTVTIGSGGTLTLDSDPTLPLQATTKQYTDAAVLPKINRLGDTMTGPLTLDSDPTTALQAATKQYTDAAVLPKINRLGDTMTGPLTLDSDPTTALQAATKQYVDNKTTVDQLLVPSTAAVTYTTPSYIVGSNRLWVFVNGLKNHLGATYDYTEDGTVGTVSTSMTFNATPAAGLIEFLVVGS